MGHGPLWPAFGYGSAAAEIGCHLPASCMHNVASLLVYHNTAQVGACCRYRLDVAAVYTISNSAAIQTLRLSRTYHAVQCIDDR